MRIIIAAVSMLVMAPIAQAQWDDEDPGGKTYRTYQEYQRAVDRQADRDYARQQANERLELQRRQVEAEEQTSYELNQMRQDQYWRDAEDRVEREHRRRLNLLP